MANPKRVTGAVGTRLAAAVLALREDRRLNQPQLAKRMEKLGIPFHPTAVSKIELRERRVDVDDLVGLAVALDTTPNRLLLPGDVSDAQAVELTPEVTVSALGAWKWATGEEPLPVPYGFLPPDRQVLVRDDRDREFTRENQPHNLPEPYFHNVGHDMSDHPELVREIAYVVQHARESGVSLGRMIRLMEHIDMKRRFGRLDQLVAAIDSGSWAPPRGEGS